jgi:hypothetical protein
MPRRCIPQPRHLPLLAKIQRRQDICPLAGVQPTPGAFKFGSAVDGMRAEALICLRDALAALLADPIHIVLLTAPLIV